MRADLKSQTYKSIWFAAQVSDICRSISNTASNFSLALSPYFRQGLYIVILLLLIAFIFMDDHNNRFFILQVLPLELFRQKKIRIRTFSPEPPLPTPILMAALSKLSVQGLGERNAGICSIHYFLASILTLKSTSLEVDTKSLPRKQKRMCKCAH